MKRVLIIGFVFMLIFSLLFVSANHRQDNQDEKFYLDKWLNNLWGKITGEAIIKTSAQEMQTIQRQPIPGICVSVDYDGDGYFPPSRGCPSPYDCDDVNSNTNPGATEVCVNNIDDNCDGQINEGCIKEISPIKQRPIELEPPTIEEITCVDSDGGFEIYTQGFINSLQGNTWNDQCSEYTDGIPSSSDECFGENCFLSEMLCTPINDPLILETTQTYDNIYQAKLNCPFGCSNGVCVQPNLEISVATLKDNYKVGEQIKLTDPPETGEVVVEQEDATIQQNFANSFFYSQDAGSVYGQFSSTPDGQIITRTIPGTEFLGRDRVADSSGFFQEQEFDGYIVEFEKPSVLAEKIRLEEKKISRISERLEKYSKNLEKEHLKLNSKISKELGKTEYISRTTIIGRAIDKITGKAIDNSQIIKIEKEFTIAFNGVVLKESLTQKEIEEIKKIKGVKEVWKNVKVETLLMDSVPLINADDVWQMQDGQGNYLTGEGIKIGIIDTGIDYTHPDLGGCYGVGCKVVGGYDFVNEDNDPMDDHGHGTHVSATAAGNGVLKGVAPDAKLYGFKVLDAGGSGWEDWIIGGIESSIDLDKDGNIMEDENDYVDIISMSLGGGGNPDDPMSQAVDNVVNAGVVAVIAAGNSGCENCIGSPGTARKAITVGASDKSDAIAGFSSRGPVVWEDINGEIKSLIKPDITAPGVSICAAQWDSAWQDRECLDTEHTAISGTSMATPHVAGVVALIKQKHPDWTPDEIKMALRNSDVAVDIGENVITQGHGRVDVLGSTSISESVIAELSSIDYNPLGIIDIYGTAKGGNPIYYEVLYSVKDSGNWNLICQGFNEINNGILCNNFYVDNLMDNKYLLKLIVSSPGKSFSKDYGIFEIDNVKILNPLNNDIYRIGDVLDIEGTAQEGKPFQNYVIEYSVEEPSGEVLVAEEEWSSTGITLINNGMNPVIEDVLGVWDTSTLDDGVYTIRITVNYLDGTFYEEEINNINLDSSFREAINVGTNGEILGELTITDLDSDGLKEIAIKGFNNVYVYNQDGSLRTGWPQSTLNSMASFPYLLSTLSIGDINNDGNKEIFASWVQNSLAEEMGYLLYGWNSDGSSLSGFPIQYQSSDYTLFLAPYTSPILSDINDDGYSEIVLGAIGGYSDPASTLGITEWVPFIFVFNNQGQIMPGWPVKVSTFLNYRISLSVGNLDNTHEKEVISTIDNYLEGGNIFIFDFEGNLKTSLPISSAQGFSLTEIDSDNKLEILNRRNSILNFINSDGTLWSSYTPGFSIYSGSFGDLDNDGIPEIVIGSNFFGENPEGFKEEIYIFNSIDGSVLNYFNVGNVDDNKENLAQEIIADINDDGQQDIIANVITPDGNQLYAWNSDGSVINGFPKNLGRFSYSFTSPAVDDIDNDGKLEILVYVWKFVEDELNPGWYIPINKILIFDLDTPYNPEKMDWPMFMHDPQHTGCYNCPSVERPQSKIVNNENFDVTGTLTMKLQKKTEEPLTPLADCALWFDGCNKCQVIDGEISSCTRKYCVEYQDPRCLESWQDVQIVTNEQVTIPANDLIKLDVGGTYGWNLKNVKADSDGDYRVYASFEFDGQKIEDSWEFEVISATPPTVALPVE